MTTNEALELSENTIKGMLVNNIIIPKEGNNEPWLFYKRRDGTIVANLDGYAIMPKEEYERLRSVCEDYEKARRRIRALERAIDETGRGDSQRIRSAREGRKP